MPVYKKPKTNPTSRIKIRNASKDDTIITISQKKGKEVREKINLSLLKEVEAKKRELKEKNRKEAFITQTPAFGEVKELVGKAFVQKNEQVMNARKKVLLGLGFRGTKLTNILYLFRLRKAASILAKARGIAPVEVVEEFHSFTKKNKPLIVRLFSNNHGVINLFIEAFDGKTRNKSDPSLVLMLKNPANESLIAEITKAQLVINPKSTPSPKLVSFTNHFVFIAMQDAIGKIIQEEIGEKYGEFSRMINEERRRI